MKKVTKETKTTKTTKAKKVFKPEFVVDLTDCTTANEVAIAFILAKTKAGVAITDEELFDFAIDAIRRFIDFDIKCTQEVFKSFNKMIETAEKPKKTPWYKKLMFWKKNK